MHTKGLPDWLLPALSLTGVTWLLVGLIGWQSQHQTPPANSTYPTSPPEALSFEGRLAYQQLLAQVELGPRPTGSQAGRAAGDLIMAELTRAGWTASAQEFIFKGVKGRNILGQKGSRSNTAAHRPLILATHYDTRPTADYDPEPAQRDQWLPGANDGASGVAVLLELARVLEIDQNQSKLWLVFFDAEDQGRLAGWPFSVGARYFAEQLAVEPQVVIIVDMVGDADQQIYFERNSSDRLNREIWAVAGELGYQAYFIPQSRHFVIDDHIPFRERNIPAVDLIDFDYPYWHTMADTADKVSPASLERVGRTLEAWLEKQQ